MLRFCKLLFLGLLGFTACDAPDKVHVIDTTRIVSLDGALTETLVLLGFQENIVGVDITSNYPAFVADLPKVGHNRNINVEGIVAMNPSSIFVFDDGLKPEAEQQFLSAGIPVVKLPKNHTVEGAKQTIQSIADTVGFLGDIEPILKEIDQKIASVPQFDKKPKVLFIYARGVGTMNVAGNNTALHTMIELAGGVNAAAEISEFKPFTPEAIVKENPDVLLLFDSGLESLEGSEGLLKVPGIAATNAGKNKKVVTMDGQFLAGFTPRVGDAVLELAAKIHE